MFAALRGLVLIGFGIEIVGAAAGGGLDVEV